MTQEQAPVSMMEYLHRLLADVQRQMITSDQERFKAIGAQEVVQHIIKDLEASNAQEKSNPVPQKPAKPAAKKTRPRK
jgi:hypothetical protein